MNRRTVLGLVAGMSSLSAVTLGSGAFGSARTEREITVEVEDDDKAYLGLKQHGYGERSDEDGTPRTVNFDFPSLEETTEGRSAFIDEDLGLGTDSVYRFVKDAEEGDRFRESDETPEYGLLEIINQGTNPIAVYSDQPETDGPKIGIFRVDPEDGTPIRPNGTEAASIGAVSLLTQTNPAELAVGESIRVGFEVKTTGSPPDSYSETIEIIGDVDS